MPRKINKQKKLHIKKGDIVMLNKRISGHPDRSSGFTGRVLKVIPETNRVIVEGVGVRIRHTKPNNTHQNGGRIEREMPIHISNVMPIDGDGNRTRIGRKKIEDSLSGHSHWVRYAITTGEELDR